MKTELKESPHQSVVRAFIRAYNRFDIEVMMEKVHEEVVFRNIKDGETTLELKGKDALRNQARESAKYFKQREQKILRITEANQQVTVDIEFTGILKKDMTGGQRAGAPIRITGHSVYTFINDLIIGIRDIA